MSTTVAVLGDAGATDASMLTYMHLAAMGQESLIDFVLHDGDIGSVGMGLQTHGALEPVNDGV